MSSKGTHLQIVARRNPYLQCLNEKIANLPQSNCGMTRSFSLAAQLAGEAIQVAEELQLMPGIDKQALQPALDFWCRRRDYIIGMLTAVRAAL